MQTRSHLLLNTFNSNFFDDSSNEWNKNKKKLGNGQYIYICNYINNEISNIDNNLNNKTLKCNNKCWKNNLYCWFHRKRQQ
jgi:hypothetical protein